MTLIDGDRIVTAQLYDNEYKVFTEKKMSIIDYINNYTNEGVTEADVIEQMPSAENTIIQCKDCKWWEKQEDSLQGRCCLMQMYPTGGWYCANARAAESEEKE